MVKEAKRNEAIVKRFGTEAHDTMQKHYGFTDKTKVEVIELPVFAYQVSSLERDGNDLYDKRTTIELERWVNAVEGISWIVGYSAEIDLFVIRELKKND